MKIRIDNLTKQYGSVTAVDKLNITINDGEFITILGPSGCGKSTLLYTISGIYGPTSGDIYFDEEKITPIKIEERNIGMVFQNYSLYPHMTVAENLMFPLKIMGVKKKQALERAIEIGKLIKCEELLNRKPKELSGGQQQRVAIGRAIIKNPKVLLMDEPFSNLDAGLRIEMREEIKELHKKTGITTLFVTHDQEEAMSISDRILVMNEGKAVQFSTPFDLYKNPNSVFVASFLGNPKINLITEKSHMEKLNCNLDLKHKTVGIRPEDIEIKLADKENSSGITGIIKEIQPMGKELYLKLSLDSLDLKAVVSSHSTFKLGNKVALTFKSIHYFQE